MSPAKTRRVLLKLFLAVVGLGVFIVLLGYLVPRLITPARPASSAPSYTAPRKTSADFTLPITYRISGTAGSVSLTYVNATGGTEQISTAGVPWEKTFQMHYGDFVYLSAQNNGERGSVICEIELDNKTWKQSTSSGAYSIASCSGSLVAR